MTERSPQDLYDYLWHLQSRCEGDARQDIMKCLREFLEVHDPFYDELAMLRKENAALRALRKVKTLNEKRQAGAIKDDDGKAQFHLTPFIAMEGAGRVLAFGAKKYEDHNWRKGMDWSRMFDAAMRHMVQFWQGQDNDPETGLPHINHALVCLMFLSEYQATETGTDDRYGSSELVVEQPAPPSPWDYTTWLTNLHKRDGKKAENRVYDFFAQSENATDWNAIARDLLGNTQASAKEPAPSPMSPRKDLEEYIGTAPAEPLYRHQVNSDTRIDEEDEWADLRSMVKPYVAPPEPQADGDLLDELQALGDKA